MSEETESKLREALKAHMFDEDKIILAEFVIQASYIPAEAHESDKTGYWRYAGTSTFHSAQGLLAYGLAQYNHSAGKNVD